LILLQSTAAHFVAMKDAEKVAVYIFQMMNEVMKKKDFAELEKATSYAIEIMGLVNDYDQEYADQVAINYLNLIKSQ
tara:strand:+ start:183 stop:413 length:231 start_codon:yes stop_codon:yes gene_type:complete